MQMPPNTGGDFEPPPAGTHLAICYRIIDLGTQQVDFQGTKKLQHKIMLSWELPDEKMDDGEPFTVHQRYTLSSHEKARLRQDLESWRGMAFTEADFGPGGFNIKNVLGVPCLLTIIHEAKQGRIYANIRAIAKPPKGMGKPTPHNPTAYLDLNNFDPKLFSALSDSLRATISKSPEYQKAVSSHVGDAGPAPRDGEPINDDIPF